MKKTTPPIKFLYITIFLCLLGVVVSAKLLHIHIFTHTDPNFHSLCAVNEGVNCETVALSPFSVFFGLPVCMWGIFGYTILLGFAIWIRFQSTSMGSRTPVLFLGFFSFMIILSMMVSAVLAAISIFKIDSICLFCMSSYMINILLFTLCISILTSFGTTLIQAIKADVVFLIRKPIVALLLFSVSVVPILLARITIEPYWESGQWIDVQQMESGVDASGVHWIGAENPIVTIVEFSDYQCPHCRLAHKNIRALVNKHSSWVRLIHRQYPLDNACNKTVKRRFHEYACVFAIAAECAGEEGKFWQMNDKIFGEQEQNKPSEINIEKMAVELGLDRSRFLECAQKKSSLPKIEADIQAAIEQHVTGTPTYFIGNHKFVGGISEERLMSFRQPLPNFR